jgi:hypothetical protein
MQEDISNKCWVCVIFFARLSPHVMCCAGCSRGVTGGWYPTLFWGVAWGGGRAPLLRGLGLEPPQKNWAVLAHDFLTHGFLILVKELRL